MRTVIKDSILKHKYKPGQIRTVQTTVEPAFPDARVTAEGCFKVDPRTWGFFLHVL